MEEPRTREADSSATVSPPLQERADEACVRPSEVAIKRDGFFLSPLREPKSLDDVKRAWKGSEIGS